MVSVVDQLGEGRALIACGFGERRNSALRSERRDDEVQIFDHLAPDIENVRASGLTLEILLRGPLIDLPCEKFWRDPTGVERADYKEVRGANSPPFNIIKRQGKIACAARGENYVPRSKESWQTLGWKRDSLHLLPVDARRWVNIPHLNYGDIAVRQLINSATQRIACRNGGDDP